MVSTKMAEQGTWGTCQKYQTTKITKTPGKNCQKQTHQKFGQYSQRFTETNN